MNIVWEGPVCWVQCANMWQDCSLSAVQRKTACVEQSWWPEFEMFGSMPWCSFPWHKLLPRLAQKTCNPTVWIWSMSLHPCFCRRWLLQVCLGKPSHGSRPLSSIDISVVLCLRKQQPRFAQGQPKGYFLTKKLDRTTEALARMNIVWEGPVCWVQRANMWQDCSLTAVQRKTACVELSWWPEFEMFGSMPWCWFHGTSSSQGWRKRLVIQQSEFDPWVYILVFAEGDCCRVA